MAVKVLNRSRAADAEASNIMVGHDGSVKVVDFGIATTTIASVHTSPGVVRGKASYLSPEQCLGDKVDHRSDVFALGVVLYELTTGARCFHGKTDAPVTEPHSIVSLPSIAEPTRPARRLARGTELDGFEDDLDERTHGRGPLRRPIRSPLPAIPIAWAKNCA